jgi:hypothetical protein
MSHLVPTEERRRSAKVDERELLHHGSIAVPGRIVTGKRHMRRRGSGRSGKRRCDQLVQGLAARFNLELD